MNGKVIVIGSLNYDIILKTDRMPLKGETHTAEYMQCCCGGKGGNQAVQCAKLGIKTYMVARVGNDCYGDMLIQGLETYDVDTTYVKRTPTASGMGLVHALHDGSVFATIVRGANYSIENADINEIIPLLDEQTILILQLEIPTEVIQYTIKAASNAHCTILFNMAPAVSFDQSYMKMCHYLIMNEVEAHFYTGKEINSVDMARAELIAFSHEMGTSCIFTLGEQGALFCKENELYYKK